MGVDSGVAVGHGCKALMGASVVLVDSFSFEHLVLLFQLVAFHFVVGKSSPGFPLCTRHVLAITAGGRSVLLFDSGRYGCRTQIECLLSCAGYVIGRFCHLLLRCLAVVVLTCLHDVHDFAYLCIKMILNKCFAGHCVIGPAAKSIVRHVFRVSFVKSIRTLDILQTVQRHVDIATEFRWRTTRQKKFGGTNARQTEVRQLLDSSKLVFLRV